MDFAYPPDVETVDEPQEQLDEAMAEPEAPSSVPTQPRAPCKEGSFSKVDWNVSAPVEDEGKHCVHSVLENFLTLP